MIFNFLCLLSSHRLVPYKKTVDWAVTDCWLNKLWLDAEVSDSDK